ELRNVIERIVIMNPTTTRFDRKHLPPLVHRDGTRRSIGAEFSTLHQARAAYERDYILKKLDDNHGNISRTAEVLGLERSHLYRKMKTLGIAVKEGSARQPSAVRKFKTAPLAISTPVGQKLNSLVFLRADG